MSQGDAPPRRSARRILAIFGLLLLAALVAAVVLREALATRAAVAYLQDQGVTVQGLEVTGLTPVAVTARDIALGDGREVAVRELAVALAWEGLTPRVTQAEITGLRLRLDVTGEAPLLGSLQPLLERFTGGESGAAAGTGPATEMPSTPLAVPIVTLTDAQIVFATPSGAMTAALSGVVEPAEGGGLQASSALRLDSELGRLRADIAFQRSPDGGLSLAAKLAEGRLAWQGFSVGAFAGSLNAAQAPDSAPRLTADFDLKQLAYSPSEGAPLELDSGRLKVDGTPAQGEALLLLDGDDERLELKVAAQQETGPEGLLASLELAGEVHTAGGLVQFLPLPGPKVTAGTLVLNGEGGGRLSQDVTRAATWENLASLLAESPLQVHGDAILADVALADGTTGISAHLPLIADLAANRLTLTLQEDAAVRVEQPARDSLRLLGVPRDLLPLVASGLNLSLAAGGNLPFRLATMPAWPPETAEIAVAAKAASGQGLALSAKIVGAGALGEGSALERFNGSIEAGAEAVRLAFGGREARNVALTLPLTAVYGDEGLRLALAKAGALRIGQFGAGAPLRLESPLDFTIDALTLESPPGSAGYRYGLRGREDGAAFTIAAAEGPPLDITAGALTLQVDGRFDPAAGHETALEIRLGGFELPAQGFSAKAAEVDVGLDRELRPATSRFAVGPFQAGGSEPLMAPMTLTGRLQRKGAGYDVSAELALGAGTVLADITGRYGDDGKARLEAASKLLTFAPEGLQPADLSPLLAALEKVDGSLNAKATFAWPRDPAVEQGQVTVTGLSFNGPAEVEGLGLSLRLDSLLPPTTAPGQRLTLSRLEAGVPVENIAVNFSLESPPRLRVADGGFDLGGARWHIEPAVLDPAAAQNRVILGTDALDLDTFFRLIEVDGLAGSGTLKGSVPIVFAGEDIIVEDGRFEAQGPGRLSLRFETLRSALAGGGETVELAIQALEDFHYENLSVTLSKTAANDTTVRLSTLGQNPAVLEGQPFQFNINLESNLTSVLEALRQGYSFSDDALRRAWKLSD